VDRKIRIPRGISSSSKDWKDRRRRAVPSGSPPSCFNRGCSGRSSFWLSSSVARDLSGPVRNPLVERAHSPPEPLRRGLQPDSGQPAGCRPPGPCSAPSPVRQGMAGSFALAIGILLLGQLGTAALVLQVLLLAALAALIFGRFCLGSFLYHLFRGKSAFAIATLPWKPGTFPDPP